MASGDVGHFDAEGRLFIDGRDDEMIVSGGENVFPAEVEELLAGHDDDPGSGCHRGRGREVRPAPQGVRGRARRQAELSEDDVKGYVKENLANYKVPREVVFVDELPRNPTGKVLKRELTEERESRRETRPRRSRAGAGRREEGAEAPATSPTREPALIPRASGRSSRYSNGSRYSTPAPKARSPG